MKKLFLFLLLLNFSFVYAEDTQYTENIEIQPDIYIMKNTHKKNLSPVEVKSSNIKQREVNHLPWSMTERRIEYDSKGQAQFTPYALNDLNLQY